MLENRKEEFLNALETGEHFDLYAQDPNDWSELTKLIPGIMITSAGGIVPFQAEGTLHGFPFYYRDRHGVAELRVGAVGSTDHILPAGALYSASVETPEFEGADHFVKNLYHLVPELKKAPFLYRFPGHKATFLNDGNWGYTIDRSSVEEALGWGHSLEEAYVNSSTPSTYLAEKGFSLEAQRKLWIDREVDTRPLNRDERAYPPVTPDFRVNPIENLK